MKNTLRINHKNNQLVMDREFSIKSSLYGSQEYNMLQAARQDYPTYQVVRKTIKKNSQKEAFDGLTYDYMERYMARYGAAPEILKKYEDMRFNAGCHSVRYPVIRKWFLETYPEVKEWGKKKEEFAAAGDDTLSA